MLSGFLHLVASQVFTRLFTFGLNLATARSLTPEAYGVATVQFHLINTTILFISREGFRRACLRMNPHARGATARILRMAALTLPFAALLSTMVTAVLLHLVKDGDLSYRQALVMQGIAAFVESCSEPLYILAATRLLFGLRVGIETAAMIAKGVLTLALIRHTAVAPALVFSWAQLAYAAITLAAYVIYFLPQFLRQRVQRSVTPGTAAYDASIDAVAAGGLQQQPDAGILHLAGTFTLQAVEKLLLAEGSKLAVAAFQSGREQGVYGLVTGLGSIAVRTLFQPFEEAAFVAFSKQQGAEPSPRPARLEREARLLSLLVRCIVVVGMLAAAFGPAYSHLALLLLYSRRWADTEAPLALGLYSLYLALLAANGILESFLHAVATPSQLYANNVALVGFTGIHATLSVLAVRAGGACALILADAVNMLLRIVYSLAFIRHRYNQAVPAFGLRSMLPSWQTLTALAAAAAVTTTSRVALLPQSSMLAQLAQQHGIVLLPPWLTKCVQQQPLSAVMGMHVAVGVACLAAVAAALVQHDRNILNEIKHLRKGGKRA